MGVTADMVCIMYLYLQNQDCGLIKSKSCFLLEAWEKLPKFCPWFCIEEGIANFEKIFYNLKPLKQRYMVCSKVSEIL